MIFFSFQKRLLLFYFHCDPLEIERFFFPEEAGIQTQKSIHFSYGILVGTPRNMLRLDPQRPGEGVVLVKYFSYQNTVNTLLTV